MRKRPIFSSIWVALLFTILLLNGNLFAQPLNNWLEFDGTNDYVNLGNSSTLKPTSALSFELWAFNDNWANFDDVGL